VNAPVHPGARRGEEAASTLELLQRLLRELPGLVSDRVELLSLELLRARRALAQIVALVVAVAILGATAWIAGWAAVAVALVKGAGLHWGWALASILAVNAATAWIAAARLGSLFPRLTLPATRRQLTLRDDEDRPDVRPATAHGVPDHAGSTRVTAA